MGRSNEIVGNRVRGRSPSEQPDDDDTTRLSGEHRLDTATGSFRRVDHASSVGDVMRKVLSAIGPDWSVAHARWIAQARDARHLIVVPRARLHGGANDTGADIASNELHRIDMLGIVSHHDLDAAHATAPVATCMSRPVVVVGISASVGLAAYVMRTRGVGALPVIEESRVAGIVTVADLRGAGVPASELELPVCVSCSGRRQLATDFHGRGVALCVECRDRSSESLPWAETGTGD